MRADHLGCYGYPGARTPCLDELAATGAVCERAFTVVPLTLPAHASIFTGLYPRETGISTNGREGLSEHVTTLAQLLQRNGYDTGAFVASIVLDSKFGLGRGFEMYDDKFASSLAGGIPQRDGDSVVTSALRWLGLDRVRPFFCWVHLYDAHTPYQAHQDVFGNEYESRTYDGEIAYIDLQIRRIVEFLRQRNLESKTLIVIVGDHGESLQEHGEDSHGLTLYNAAIHVPLIFNQPKRVPSGLRMEQNVSVVDLSPTILEILGVPDITRNRSGRSFMKGLTGHNVATTKCYSSTDDPLPLCNAAPLRSLIDGEWKYIRSKRPELYNLSTDPHELVNLADTDPERLQDLESTMAEWEERIESHSGSSIQLSESEAAALKSLGYVGGTSWNPDSVTSSKLFDIKDMLRPLQLVFQADTLLSEGNMEASRACLRTVVHDFPRMMETVNITVSRLKIARELKRQSQLEDAAEELLCIVDANPLCQEAHLLLGEILVDLDRPGEAVSELEEAVKLDAENSIVRLKLVSVLAEIKNYDAALKHLGIILTGMPRNWRALWLRGSILRERGKHDEAINALRKALQYSASDDAALYLELGQLLAAHGDQREALARLARAVELNSESADIRVTFAEVLFRNHHLQFTINELNEALRLDPHHSKAKELMLEVQGIQNTVKQESQ